MLHVVCGSSTFTESLDQSLVSFLLEVYSPPSKISNFCLTYAQFSFRTPPRVQVFFVLFTVCVQSCTSMYPFTYLNVSRWHFKPPLILVHLAFGRSSLVLENIVGPNGIFFSRHLSVK